MHQILIKSDLSCSLTLKIWVKVHYFVQFGFVLARLLRKQDFFKITSLNLHINQGFEYTYTLTFYANGHLRPDVNI